MLIVPGDPISKGRPRVVGSNTYTPARTRVHEKRIKMAWQAHHGHAITHPLPKQLDLTVIFRCATKRRTDIDNLLKTVMDALNGAAYSDDSQIVHLEVEVLRGVGADSANTQLRVCEWARDK
jgi:crossover junction endodeoxyribonuclease RusA